MPLHVYEAGDLAEHHLSVRPQLALLGEIGPFPGSCYRGRAGRLSGYSGVTTVSSCPASSNPLAAARAVAARTASS